jgi:site-specific DNA-methyltransferase (cytosine-N4-specific)
LVSRFFIKTPKNKNPVYETEFGEAWAGDSKKIIKQLDDKSINLIITSPPYALIKKKEYGNENEDDYVRWFRPFAREFYRVLKDDGSLVMNIGGAWKKGVPSRSLYPYQLLLDLCCPSSRRHEAPRFYLAQEFYWLNPAKIPNPIEWVNVRRIRVKDAVEHVWWLSKTNWPKADNRKVLVPYSKHMKRLLDTGIYNDGMRPSGWNIAKSWAQDNGGAIPPNFRGDDSTNLLLNLLVISNTSSNDVLHRALKEKGGKTHPAMYPKDLPEFFIKLLTDEDDVILDPFSGSNSSGYMAEELKRRWISIDINTDYVENSRFRWEKAPELFKGKVK